MAVFDDILTVLTDQARVSFKGLVADVDQQVLPTMESLARDLTTLAGLKAANPDYPDELAVDSFEAQKNAALAVLIRFANATLEALQQVLNAMLSAIGEALNRMVGLALIPV